MVYVIHAKKVVEVNNMTITPIKQDSKAPAFKLKDKEGKQWSLSDIKTDFVVLYFYPKDNTPGCTLEARDFNSDIPKYKKASATVIGISGGDEKTKTKFCEKHGLKILLLSDPDGSVGKKYGAYGKKKFMGREYMGFMRYTFLLNKKRKIIHVWDKVKPFGHSKEVFEKIKESR